MKLKKTIAFLLAMLMVEHTFLPAGTISVDIGKFRKQNTFFDYDAVATANGTWGAIYLTATPKTNDSLRTSQSIHNGKFTAIRKEPTTITIGLAVTYEDIGGETPN